MPPSKNRVEYIDNWKKENTDLLRIRVPKGKKTEYQALAKRRGKSLTALIVDCLEEKLKEEQ